MTDYFFLIVLQYLSQYKFETILLTILLNGIKCGCKINWLWVWSPLEEMKYLFKNVYFHFFASLSSATQHTISLEFGAKWGTKCLNTTFPLLIFLCKIHIVKLIYSTISEQCIQSSDRFVLFLQQHSWFFGPQLK